MEAVISYVHNEDDCRTRQLLQYFGEEDYKRCGICDNCINRDRHQHDEAERQHYKKQIFQLLREVHEVNEEKLVRILDPDNKELFLTLLSELVDHAQLYYDDFGYLNLSRTHN